MAVRVGSPRSRQAGRLVRRDHQSVAGQDAGAERAGFLGLDRGLGPLGGSFGLCLAGAQWRDADFLALGQAQTRLGAPALDPDLTGAQEFLQPAMGEGGKVTPEPTVEPDAVIRRLDASCLHPAQGST